jgi:hypothetical protein
MLSASRTKFEEGDEVYNPWLSGGALLALLLIGVPEGFAKTLKLLVPTRRPV